MTALKTLFFRIYFSMALITEPETTFIERIKAFFYWLVALGPVMFISDTLQDWFLTHQGFTIATLVFISLNMLVGGRMHNKRGDFQWPIFFKKTTAMIWVMIIVYFTLEVLISIAGDNVVVTTFRIALQISTLLYPGSKILKNAFILSRGQFPPEWIMKRIYNFQKNGDLKYLFDMKNPEDYESAA